MARVRPDVSGLDKVFDYLVPPEWGAGIEIGSLVRFDLHGRRVAGWVVALDVDPLPGITLRELRSLSSVGPSDEVVGLADWAAHRWHGRTAAVLKTASPDRMVRSIGPPVAGPQKLNEPAAVPGTVLEFRDALSEALGTPGVSVLRVGPGTDLFPAFEAAASVGNAVVVLPDVDEARHLGGRFRRAGGRISLAGRDWAEAARGGLVTGARSAVWATVPDLQSILVLDEHDERLQEERNPTWHARTVAIERARRLRIPCVLVSPTPSLEALVAADRNLSLSRTAERGAWPRVEIIDRRNEDPGTPGPFSSALAAAIRATGGEGRVLAVLNRKGRAPLLACATCGELVRTLDGERVMSEVGGELVASTGERRPKVCALCGATKLKRLRLGVDRAREELEALVGEPVGELTAETSLDVVERHRIIVGTEAVLHRVNRADLVVFLDFDQELLAPRFRAAEQAMALLVLAARVLGGRDGPGHGGRLLVQTRSPDHRVLEAVVRADPSRWAEAELAMRRSLSLPPFVSLAEVSGAGAEAFVEPLRSTDPWRSDVDVLGPRADGRFLLRAATAEQLADALDAAASIAHRPKQRVRVAVDPPRV